MQKTNNPENNWADWEKRIVACQAPADLEDVRVALLGKNGQITQELKKLGAHPPEERRRIGQELNERRDHFESCIKSKKIALEEQALEEQLNAESIDITLPPRPENTGYRHLLSQIAGDLVQYFQSQGFRVVTGPEIDSEHNNFEALNIPEHHPSRQDQDTFYLKDMPGMLLRPHTSTLQVRTLSTLGVPVRAVSIGAVLRNDAVDATHSPLFHQIEIFVVEPGITAAHMKRCLLDLLSFLFRIDLAAQAERGEPIPVRFRPSFFPFTEPSIEVDACCIRKNGELKLDLAGDWLEILGCGMIHPNVFAQCGVQNFPSGEPVQGFAIGIGIERIAMLKYGITDIRHFYEGDTRWLNHYGAH